MTAGFSLLIIVMFHFAFDVGTAEATRFFPGAMWTAIFFSGTLSMARGVAADGESNEQWALLLVPIDRSALFLAKLVFHLCSLLLVELVSVPLFIASFGLTRVESPGMFLTGLFLGTWGLVSVGTVFAGLAGGIDRSGLFFPLMLFPLLVPVALGSTAIVAASVGGDVTSLTWTWVKLLLFFNLVFTVIPALFYEYVLEVS